MNIELHTWKVTGIKPLMQSNPAETLIPPSTGLTARKPKVYDDKKEARIRLYLDDKGKPYHPAMAFRAGLLTAAASRKVGKITAKAAISAAVDCVEEEFYLENPKTWKPLTVKDYVIDVRRVVINKAGVLRARPKWKVWGGHLVLEIDMEQVDLELVTELLNVAGRIAGLGDGRPDTSKGKGGVLGMGKYTVEFVQ